MQSAREAGRRLVAGQNLIAYCAAEPTDSNVLFRLNAVLDALFFYDPLSDAFVVDSPILPPSRRNITPVRPGDAFFGRATGPAIFEDSFESGDTS